MAHWRSRFVWYELMTLDMAAAESFYKEVIGWQSRQAAVPGPPYTMFTINDRPVCGAMSLPDTARAMGIGPRWLGYIAVDDVDTLAADIVIEGGVVHRAAADIPGIGRFAIVSDPQGATFALFQATGGEPPPEVEPGTLGHVDWRELYVEDTVQSLDFYGKMFGWQQNRDYDLGEPGWYHVFGIDNVDMGGMMKRPPTMQQPMWTFYFSVDAIDAAADRVKAAGGQVVFGPIEVPGNLWIVQCLDQQGALFALKATRR